MNYKFNLKDLEVTIEGTPLKIGEFNVEVTDMDLKESLRFARELPAMVREIKDVFAEDEHMVDDVEFFMNQPQDEDDYSEINEEIYQFEAMMTACDWPVVDIHKFWKSIGVSPELGFVGIKPHQRKATFDWLDEHIQAMDKEQPVAEF